MLEKPLRSTLLRSAAIFGIALAVRIAVWSQLSHQPLFRAPQLDSLEYVAWGSRIAAGDFRWPAPPPHGPGYPFFLGGVFALFSGSLSTASLIQALLGALNCVAVAALAGTFFGPLVAWASGLLLAVYGVVAWTDISLLAEVLLLLLSTAALLCVGKGPVPFSRAALAGLLTGLAALVRPTALVLLPVILVVLARRKTGRGGGSRRAGLAAVAAAAAGLALLPVTIANWLTSRAPLLVQGHGGFNFYIGNSPSGTGLPTVRPGAGWDRLEGEAARNGFRLPAEQDRYFLRKTAAEIAAAPFRYAALLGKKLFWTIQADEIRESFSFSFFEKASPFLSALPGFGLLFPFALAGILVSLRSPPRDRAGLLLGYALATGGACVLLVTSSRYRLPFVVALVPFAALGLVTFARLLRERSPRAAVLAGVVLAGAALCRIERHASSHNLAEEWSGTGYALIHLRDLDGAGKAFREAIAQDAGWSPAWAGLGVIEANRGDPAAARGFFEKSLQLQPDNLAARLQWGAVLEGQRRPAEAELVYARALETAPHDPAFGHALARALLAQGRLAEASTRARELLSRDPEDAAAHLLLARVLGAARQPKEAASEAERAARLDPGDAEAYFTLAMLSLDAADLDRAEEALLQAESLGTDARRVGMARAVLFQSRGRFDRADEVLRRLLARDRDYKPAAALLLQNACALGRENEARDYLRALAGSGT